MINIQQTVKSDKLEQDNLRRNLERKVAEAQELNESLQLELVRLQADKDKQQEDLEEAMEKLKTQEDQESGQEWRERYEDLQKDYTHQQEVTEAVRREAAQFLREMREISEHGGTASENEERLALQVAKLEREVKEWKDRYARAKAQNGRLRTSTTGLLGVAKGLAGSGFDGQEVEHVAGPDGVVRDVHFTAFQASVDDFLRKAREEDTDAVVDGMKDVVQSVKDIIRDFDEGSLAASARFAAGNEHDIPDPHNKLRMAVNATANNLIVATQNHIIATGLSPVSLLDAAASHLTTAVIQLVRTVGIRVTGEGEEDAGSEVVAKKTEKPITQVNGNDHHHQPAQHTQREQLLPRQYNDNKGPSNGASSTYKISHDDFASSPASSPDRDSWNMTPEERLPLPMKKGFEDFKVGNQ